MAPLPHRAIQVGLSGEAVDRYVEEWITGVDDITEFVAEIRGNVHAGDLDKADAAIPREDTYPLPDALRHRLGASRRPLGGESAQRRSRGPEAAR